MKYSNLLDTKIMTERSGPQMPRLVYRVDNNELLEREFLDWDILNANTVKVAVNSEINERSQSDIQLQANIDDIVSDFQLHQNNKENPHQVTAAQVGLGNVTNESKQIMFTNSNFTGVTTAETPTIETNSDRVATTSFVKQIQQLLQPKLINGSGVIIQDNIISLTNEMLDTITSLTENVFPLVVTLIGGGVYEVGTSPTITLEWESKVNNISVIPELQQINGVDSISPSIYNPVDTVSYTLKVEYNNMTVEKTITAQFVNASYYGVIESDFNVLDINTLNKDIKNTQQLTTTYNNLINKRVCYAYPSSFGNLTSIKDDNGFNYINSYTLSTVNMDEITYNVYTLTDPTTITSFKQIYN